MLSHNILMRTRATRTLRSAVLGGALLTLLLFAPASLSFAASSEERIRLLEQAIEDLLRRDAEKDSVIEKLSEEIRALKAGNRGSVEADHAQEEGEHAHQHGQDDHDHGKPGHSDSGPDLYSVDVAGGRLRLRGIGVDTALAVGGSTESGEDLQNLQGNDHDPDENGFTLQTIDIGILGAYDPYFDAEANIAIFLDNEGETKVELEEAFLRTQKDTLPYGLEVEAGQMFTEFGVWNPQHFHDRTWLDQPVILTRLFGEDNLRAPGVRLGWTPTFLPSTTLHLGAQNAFGETMSSCLSSDEAFEERPIGGRDFNEQDVESAGDLAYLARVANHFDLGSAVRMDLGLSGVTCANSGDADGDGRTYIGGADLVLQYDLPSGHQLSWQTELLYRNYDVDRVLEDYGFYTQALYAFDSPWALGLRYEYATGDGASVGDFDGRDDDPFRADRQRLSPLLVWQFAPTGRARLQYNYDHADNLDDETAHSIWFGVEWAFGAGEAVHFSNTAAAGHAH